MTNVASCVACAAGTYQSGSGMLDVQNCTTCPVEKGGRRCQSCQSDRFGDDCTDVCSSSVTCAGHGHCTGYKDECECLSPWSGLGCSSCPSDLFGPRCDQFCTPDLNCSGNGYCDGSLGQCVCVAGWLGEGCTQLCPAGDYCPAGSENFPCPAGTYQTGVGMWGVSDCSLCVAGTFSSALGALSSSVCALCGVGTYQSKQGGTPGDCVQCAAGTYQTGLGVSACTTCETGLFQSGLGASSCSRCPLGSFCPNSTVLLLCVEGTFQTGLGMLSQENCTFCLAGKYQSLVGMSDVSSCIACPPGKYSSGMGVSACVMCWPGTYQSGLGQADVEKCLVCSAGKYQTGSGTVRETDCDSCGQGTYQTGTGITAADSCFPCGIGTYQTGTGMTAVSECVACGFGKYQTGYGATNESSCLLCRAGSYQTRIGMVNDSACLACPAGTYQTGEGMRSFSDCSQCAPGQYMTGTGYSLASCYLCMIGTFQTGWGRSACSFCSSGKYYTGQGATSEADCALCGLGTYQSGTGQTDKSDCKLCEAGKYQTGSGISSSSLCIVCRIGTYQANKGKTSPSDCLCCSPGSYQTGVGISAPDSCILCGKGMYQTGTGMTAVSACVACGPGKYQTGYGAANESSCLLCRAGSYQTGIGMVNDSACLACPAGTYQTGEGMQAPLNCTKCWSNSYQTGYGMKSIYDCITCPVGKYQTGTGMIDGLNCTVLVVPTSDIGLAYTSKALGNGHFAAQLSWVRPTNTGYGDNTTISILGYYVQASSCSTFKSQDSCLVYAENVTSSAVTYPVVYNISFDLWEGYYYYFRVFLWNSVGISKSSEVVFKQYGSIDVQPFIDTSSAALAFVVLGNGSIQVWQGITMLDKIEIRIFGIPVVRSSRTVVSSISYGNFSVEAQVLLVSSFIQAGTVLRVSPPTPENWLLNPCSQFPARLSITFPVSFSRNESLGYSLEYTCYPKMQLLSLAPWRGSVNGNTLLTLTILDPRGPMTREGAALPNLWKVFRKESLLTVFFSGRILSYLNSAVLVSVSQSSSIDSAFDIAIKTPAVPTAGFSDIKLRIDNTVVEMESTSINSAFQYIGTQILSVLPSSGMLNPGSGGLDLTIKIANFVNAGFKVLIGNFECPVQYPLTAPMVTAVGTESIVVCHAPELPLNLSGALDIDVQMSSNKNDTLNWTWQNDIPPPINVDLQSVSIDKRSGPPLWAAAKAKFTLSLTLQNVCAKYGRFLSQMFANGIQITPSSVIETNSDLRVIVNLPGYDPSVVAIRLSVEMYLTHTTSMPLDAVNISVEIRDISQPRIAVIVPSQVAAQASTILALGIVSAQTLSPTVQSLCSISWIQGNMSIPVLGVVPLSDWMNMGKWYQNAMKDVRVSNFFAGLNDDLSGQFANLGSATAQAAIQQGQSSGSLNSSAIVLLQWNQVANLKADIYVNLKFQYGSSVLLSSILVSADTDRVALVNANTDDGKLNCGLAGQINLYITLTEFCIVQRAKDIFVRFDDQYILVQRLYYSGPDMTRLVVVVPSSNVSKISTVSVFPARQPSNLGTFSFEYIDDNIPVVTDFTPYQVYSSGGDTLIANMQLCPSVSMEAVYVTVQFSGSILPKILPVSFNYGLASSTLVFTTPSVQTTAVSNALFSVFFTKCINCAPVSTKPVSFQIVPDPTSPAIISRLQPSSVKSSGGEKVTLYLTNMKMVASGRSVVAAVLLGETSVQVNCSIISSSIQQTVVSFLFPNFLLGGNAGIRVWESSRPSLAATGSIYCQDISIPVLNYRYPGTGFSGQTTLVDVSVSNFGALQRVQAYSLLGASGVNGTVTSARLGSNGFMYLTVLVQCSVPTVVNLTLQRCQAGQCKTVVFDFEFLDANTPYISYFSPVTAYTDGRIPVNIAVKNLPWGFLPSKLLVTLTSPADGSVSNAPISSILYSQQGVTSDAAVTIIIPEAPGRIPGDGFALSLQWTQVQAGGESTVALAFPTTFSYSKPPSVEFGSVLPSFASTSQPNPVTMTIQNFPGVQALSDIVVEFSTVGNNNPIPAAVTSMNRINSLQYKLAVQDITVQILTPAGKDVQAGYMQISAYHSLFSERVATLNNFLMVNAAAPQVKGITSETGNTGGRSIAVRLSSKTKVTVLTGGAPQAAIGGLIGSASLNLLLSAYDSSSGTASTVFYAPPSSCQVPCDPVPVMLTFSGTCGQCTDAQCCKTETCGSKCDSSCLTACLMLTYYDDSQPTVTYQSVSSAPSLGGQSMILRLINFPVVSSGFEITTGFLAGNVPGTVYVSYSNLAETQVTILTPSVDLEGQDSVSYSSNFIFANSKPNRISNFPFTFFQATPAIQSITPTSGLRTGGVLVNLLIQNLMLAASDVGIVFGNAPVPDSSVTVVPTNNPLVFAVSFQTLSTPASSLHCRLYQKSCPIACSVNFDFIQTETVRFVNPVPSSAALSSDASGAIVAAPVPFRVKGFPGKGSAAFTCFQDSSSKDPIMSSPNRVDSSSSSSITTIWFLPPTIIGTFMCNLGVTDKKNSNVNVSIGFPFAVSSALGLRILSISPSQAGTVLNVFGRAVSPRTKVTVLVAAFPQGLQSSDLLIPFEDSSYAQVISVDEVATCTTTSADCNRTRISFSLPQQSSPRLVSGRIMYPGGSASTILWINISYFALCDLQTFCSGLGLLADPRKIADNPPGSSSCDSKYCFDPTAFQDPAVISVSPTEGPATGGTLVTIIVSKMPIVSSLDVSLQVGSGASQVLGNLLSVSQSVGSTLFTGTSTFTFRTLAAATTVTEPLIIPHTLVSAVGTVTRQVSFSLTFNPVFEGNVVVKSIYPSTTTSFVSTLFTLQLTNLPRISPPDPSRITVSADCAASGSPAISATLILASTYASTTARFPITATVVGNCTLSVMLDSYGPQRAGSASIAILPLPSPSVVSWFPLRATRGQAVTITVTSFDPSIRGSDVSVSVVDQTTSVVSFQSLSASGCNSPACTKFKIQFIVPQTLKDDGAALLGAVNITSRNKIAHFDLPIDSSIAPRLISIQPASIDLVQASATNITLYLSQASAVCSLSSAYPCYVTIGNARGRVLHAADSGGLRLIVIRAPFLQDTSVASCSLWDPAVPSGIQFCDNAAPIQLSFNSPPLEVVPVDSLCTGGSSVTITATGWPSNFAKGQLAVMFGGQSSPRINVMPSTSSKTELSKLVFTVVVPELSGPSASISASVMYNDKPVPFPYLFECFSSPTMTISPSQAALDGTTSTGGRSITVKLSNFPSLSSASDVSAVFGGSVCDGSSCSILSFMNGAGGVQVVISVPRSDSAQDVPVIVTYCGKARPPPGGDPSIQYFRSQRSALGIFTFYIPPPVVKAVLFCAICNAGRACIANGRCGNGNSPLADAMAASAAGALTITVDNVPSLSADGNGQVISPGNLAVQLGGLMGVVGPVLFSGNGRLKFEVRLQGATNAADVVALVSAQADVSVPLSSSASFALRIFDDTVSLSCVTGGCTGPSVGGSPFLAAFFNFPLTDQKALEQVVFQFDSLVATSVSLVNWTAAATIVQINPPQFNCTACTFNAGSASISLKILTASDGSVLAQTHYTFWQAPVIALALFDSSGTTISVTFDQATNLAGMSAGDEDCLQLFDPDPGFGQGARCVWQTDALVAVLLGRDPIVEPGAALAMRKWTSGGGGLRSANGVSQPSGSSTIIGRPSQPVAPTVTLKGPDIIDPCASLEVLMLENSLNPSVVL